MIITCPLCGLGQQMIEPSGTPSRRYTCGTSYLPDIGKYVSGDLCESISTIKERKVKLEVAIVDLLDDIVSRYHNTNFKCQYLTRLAELVEYPTKE